MSTIVDCPSCNRKLRVPDDLLGKKVKCPTCSGTFDALAKSSTPSTSGSSNPSPAGSAMPQMSADKGNGPSSAVADRAPPAPPGASESPPNPVPASEQETLSQVAPKSAAEEELVPCPYCGEKNPFDATRCSYCREHLDDEDQADRPWDRGYRPYRDVRRDSEPHRGTLILVMGILSIVLSSLMACSYGITGLFGLPLGICAWVMGQKDLKKMRSNVMDPQGLGSTQAGWICGIIGTAFGAIGILLILLAVGFFIVMMQTTPRMTPATPPAPAVRPAAPPAQKKKDKGAALPRRGRHFAAHVVKMRPMWHSLNERRLASGACECPGLWSLKEDRGHHWPRSPIAYSGYRAVLR